MPDDSTPTPPAGGQPDKPRRPRSALNQEQIDNLNKAEKLCEIARSPDYSGPLAAREIDAAFLTALDNDIDAARHTAGSAVSGSASREKATEDEKKAMRELQDAVREIQKAAKQKYGDDDETQLGHYYVGARLNQRARLEQIATAIADRLSPGDGGAPAADTLPGITAAKVTQLRTLLGGYGTAELDQTKARRDASGARGTLADQLESINKRRRKLQLAADAEWPHTNDNNAATRRAFKLPPNRPFNA